MKLTNKLKIAMIELNVSQTELANKTNQSQSNLSKKMKADNFNIHEYEKLVKALGCTLDIKIILPSGQVL